MNQIDISNLQLETLYGIKFARESLTVWVISSGCTTKDDFKVLVSFSDPRSTRVIAVVRMNQDRCLAAPREVGITFSWEDVGIEPSFMRASPVTVANPFGVQELPDMQPVATPS